MPVSPTLARGGSFGHARRAIHGPRQSGNTPLARLVGEPPGFACFSFDGAPALDAARSQDIPVKDLHPSPGLQAFLQRFHYAVSTSMVTIAIGEVGGGRSTSLPTAASALHPSQYRVCSAVAAAGRLPELLRQIRFLLGDPSPNYSFASTCRPFRNRRRMC